MNRSKRPTKRPDRRYYHDLFREARRFRVDLGRRFWMSLWHQHFDWEGFGDLGWLHRRRHVSALLQALARARVELHHHGMPHQLFATVHVPGSADDALYVHTQNPHSAFPCEITGRPLSSLPAVLAGLVDLRLYEVLVSRTTKRVFYTVRPRQHVA